MAAHLTAGNKIRFGYPKSRQQHDATIDKLKAENDENDSPIKPSLKTFLIRGVIMILYLLLGGLAFRSLERKDTLHGRDNILVSERKLLMREYNISKERLQKFEDLVRSRKTDPKDWDYYQSVYFASTVTTTIGYGHITPQTQNGRVFLIIFALIGIPLNILVLASVGEHITVAIFHFIRYISARFCHKARIKHINIKVMLVSIFLMFLMLFVGGFLYCSTEEWTYVDSIYYCFVAMATIGFGDLVPNKGRAPDTKSEKAIWFLRALYLSVGLSLVSTVFTALSNAIEEINFLLAKPKERDGLEETDDGKKNRRKSKRSKRSSNTEKISYKHKIKKHGNIVFKYKFLHKFKRRKDEGYIHTDWDSLLEEAKQKQHETMINSPVQTSFLSSNQNGFTQENFNANTHQKTHAYPIISDGETTSTNVTEGDYELSPRKSNMSNSSDGTTSSTRIQHNVHRMHSTPIFSNGRRDFTILHSPITRARSQPVGYNRTMHQNLYIKNQNNHIRKGYSDTLIEETTEHHQQHYPNRIYGERSCSPQWFDASPYSYGDNNNDSSRKAYIIRARTQQEYDIIMNQC